MAGKEITLKKGELLFKEGEESRALYLIKSGILRIFKSKIKGDQIEIGTVKSNEMLGEMSFLDGSPRSASVEALQETNIVEIDFGTLKKYIDTQPPWFSGMLRSITGRLRDANNRIKQLETAQVSISYKRGASGQMESQFEYLSQNTIVCFLVALQCASKDAVVEIAPLKKYYQYLFQENPTKILEMVNFFAEQNILDLSEFKEGTGIIKMKDYGRLNSYIDFLASEAKKEDEERFNLSKVNFLCAEMIYANLSKKAPNVKEVKDEKKPDAPPITKVEIYAIVAQVKENLGKNLILDNFTDLSKNNLFPSEIEIVSPTEAYAIVNPLDFFILFPNLKLQYDLKNFNEEKTAKVRGK